MDNFEKIFKLIDKDGSGHIDKEEMALFVAQLKALQKDGNFKKDVDGGGIQQIRRMGTQRKINLPSIDSSSKSSVNSRFRKMNTLHASKKPKPRFANSELNLNDHITLRDKDKDLSPIFEADSKSNKFKF